TPDDPYPAAERARRRSTPRRPRAHRRRDRPAVELLFRHARHGGDGTVGRRAYRSRTAHGDAPGRSRPGPFHAGTAHDAVRRPSGREGAVAVLADGEPHARTRPGRRTRW